MAGLQNLKKQLRSIRATGQLAGAMKTVSAAKYSKISLLAERFSGYADAARALQKEFGAAFSAAIPGGNSEAPDCFVVLSANRGLCGGYNVELLAYAMKLLREHTRPYLLMTGGKMAQGYFAGKGIPVYRAYTVPDVPSFADVQTVSCDLLSLFQSGEISSVRLVYQHFQNMLTQLPADELILPFSGGNHKSGEQRERDILCLPDEQTVVRSACLTCYNAGMYAVFLEVAAGAQASTMMAMRSAYDNAEETSAQLETELNRRRQSEVTAGVIETVSEFDR